MAGRDNHHSCLLMEGMFIIRPILMKFGIDIVALVAIPKSYFSYLQLVIASWQMQELEMGGMLAPLNIRY